MLKLNKERLLKDDSIKKIQFNNDWYFDIDSIGMHLGEDLSEVQGITLPFGKDYKKAAKIEDIENGRKQEPLSEFNQALMKAKNFNPKK